MLTPRPEEFNQDLVSSVELCSALAHGHVEISPEGDRGRPRFVFL
jgi:hypothetical protein